MRIRHLLPSTSSRSEVEGPRAFLLRNQTGSFFSQYTKRQSRYEGLFIQENDIFYKILERIEIAGQPIIGLVNLGHTIFWEHHNGIRLGWKLLGNRPGLTVSASHAVPLEIHLDPRAMYQLSEWNREISATEELQGLLVRCSDPSLPKPLFLHLRTKDEIILRNEWQSVEYPRDEQRHSPPDSRYVYHLATIRTDLLAIGVGWSSTEAHQASLAASKQRSLPPNSGSNYTHETLVNQVSTAKATTLQSLRWLQSEKGIWAGLPWFHQVWARDELITALGFTREEQLEIINRYLGHPLLEGELETYLGSKSSCADGVGWLCLLAREYGLSLLPEDTRTRLQHFLQSAHTQLKTFRQSSLGLIASGHNATWMDTIGRAGYRLEIQTMYALLLEELYTLTDKEEYRREQLKMLGVIKQHFWQNGVLRDAPLDKCVRPNIFLAYLLQPSLLRRQDWQQVFDQTISQLLCPWGGLSSLSRLDPAFQNTTTGEDNKSYHNGDSWFFMNNLAAIAMHRLNTHHFGKVVLGILESSTGEILWHNMVGHPGEISSASALESFGCGLQGFSGGTYIALLQELEGYSTAHGNDATSFFWESTAPSAA